MGTKASILLVVIGAVLLSGIPVTVAGVSINTIAVILIVVGAIGLLASLIATTRTRHERAPADPLSKPRRTAR